LWNFAFLLYREECSPDVQPNDFVEMLLSHLADGGELATTRAGEKDINLAFLLPDCFVKAIEIIKIGGIAQNPGDILPDFLYSRSLSRPVMKAYAPSSMKSLAVASAIPEVPPVITATLFTSFFMMRVFEFE
jgi:hypothetical protein